MPNTAIDSLFQGYQPEVTINKGNPEAMKYGKIWEFEQYRRNSPGEDLAQQFLKHARPKELCEVIDFGCGTGRGGLALALFGNVRVTLIDFVNNALDEDMKNAIQNQRCMVDGVEMYRFRFIKHDLEKPIPVVAEYGYCTDVMEHIPEANVDKVLDNILHSAQHVFFSISFVQDVWGVPLIGEELHLTQKDYAWWLKKFNERECYIHYTEECSDGAFFYVSAWVRGKVVVDAGVLNVGIEKIRENVRTNIGAGWHQVSPHPTNDLEAMILGSGPSLNHYLGEIRRLKAAGVKCITLNGAYNWAIEKGLRPSAQIVVDARPFNARFTKPVLTETWRVPGDDQDYPTEERAKEVLRSRNIDDQDPAWGDTPCVYLIASQCDPATLEGLPKNRTYLWHTSYLTIKDILDELYEKWYIIPGGSTVLLRSLPMMRMLGYRKFHLFGCDSCVMESSDPTKPKAHHAFDQPENDKDKEFPIIIGSKTFYCHPWMASQAQEFMDLIKFMGNELELEVYGNGLLAWILRHAADLQEIKERLAIELA